MPVCLTVAGSDSGGGAGIQADLKAFEYFNVFGASIITAVTAQNPVAVKSIFPIPVEEVKNQLGAVFDAFNITAIKTGMLYSVDIIRGLLEFLEEIDYQRFLIVDPVMIAGCGDALSQNDNYILEIRKLFQMSQLVTPNLSEAERLLGRALTSYADMVSAVRELSELYETGILLKGGHIKHELARDWYCDGNAIYEISCPSLQVKTTHGTGCRLSSAIAANLAKGKSILDSIQVGKVFVYQELQNVLQVGNQCFALGQPLSIDESEMIVNQLVN